jgi:hypothetical protein
MFIRKTSGPYLKMYSAAVVFIPGGCGSGVKQRELSLVSHRISQS